MVAVRGTEAVSLALLFSFAFVCARFLLDRLVYKVQWQSSPPPSRHRQIRAGFREISRIPGSPQCSPTRRDAGAGDGVRPLLRRVLVTDHLIRRGIIHACVT
jgi:hypothetical protein